MVALQSLYVLLFKFFSVVLGGGPNSVGVSLLLRYLCTLLGFLFFVCLFVMSCCFADIYIPIFVCFSY